MRGTLKRLWKDDRGSVLATEYTLLISVVVVGAGAGLVHVRDRTNAGLAATGDLIQGLAPPGTAQPPAGRPVSWPVPVPVAQPYPVPIPHPTLLDPVP